MSDITRETVGAEETDQMLRGDERAKGKGLWLSKVSKILVKTGLLMTCSVMGPVWSLTKQRVFVKSPVECWELSKNKLGQA